MGIGWRTEGWSMTDCPGKRVLLIARRRAFHDLFHRLGAGMDSWSQPGLPGPAWLGPQSADSVLDGLHVESASDERDGIDRVRESVHNRRPYAVVAVDFHVPYREGVALVHRLWEADPNVLILGCVADEGEIWDQIASQLEHLDRFVFLRDCLSIAELRQAIAWPLRCQAQAQKLDRSVREAESARAALAQAREEVAEARRAKANFLANVNHEIRTPMNAVLGFSELLLKEPLRDDHAEKLRRIHEAGESVLALFENMLDVAQLNQGTFALQSQSFRIEHALRQALEAPGALAENKRLELTWQIDDAIPGRLRGDPDRYEQVLHHLLDNAVKFTSAGSVHLRILLDEETPSTVLLRTVVSDTGIGIPPDRQAAIFESFSQADGSATRTFGGIGLGLTICKQLVDLMNGQIGFNSVPGEGSTFWLILPFEKDLEEIDSQDEAPAVSRRGSARTAAAGPAVPAPLSNGKRRVLAADDDKLARALVELVLTRAGCFVDLVADGREALDVLGCNHYDLLLLDLQMPNLDGLETLRRVRQREEETDRRLPVICLTSHDSPEDRQRCHQAGADDFLAKPFTFESLVTAVDRQLPGLLPSDPAADSSRLPALKDLGETLEKRLCSLRSALDQPDFPALESQARELKELASQAGSEAVADQAMRVQLAARRRDLRRVAAAVERLDRALKDQTLFQPNSHPATCSR